MNIVLEKSDIKIICGLVLFPLLPKFQVSHTLNTRGTDEQDRKLLHGHGGLLR